MSLKLYLIPFLHQTTTCFPCCRTPLSCILFHFYIKPQLGKDSLVCLDCCILFHFYIKPQHCSATAEGRDCCILFHFYIKPQHSVNPRITDDCCILFHFYIKPQQYSYQQEDTASCILFHFYIKPQHIIFAICLNSVVSYSISTSNHNLWRIRRSFQAHYHLNHILIFNGML